MTDGWVELETAWYDPTHRTCPVCGRLITRRVWRFQDDAATLDVCEPVCETLYRDYYLPTHGRLGEDLR